MQTNLLSVVSLIWGFRILILQQTKAFTLLLLMV